MPDKKTKSGPLEISIMHHDGAIARPRDTLDKITIIIIACLRHEERIEEKKKVRKRIKSKSGGKIYMYFIRHAIKKIYYTTNISIQSIALFADVPLIDLRYRGSELSAKSPLDREMKLDRSLVI